MSKDTKKFLYSLSQLLFQWSLIYLLVLFFLEDLKPFLVSSQFSPHWLILVVILSAVGIFRFAKYSEKDEKKIRQQVSTIDNWFINILSVIISLLWLVFIKGLLGFWFGLFLAVLFYFLIKKTTIWFLNN